MSTITDFKEEEIEEMAKMAAGLSKVFGFLDEEKHRNFLIRLEFKKLRKEGKSIDGAELALGELHNLSKERVHTIIYRKIK